MAKKSSYRKKGKGVVTIPFTAKLSLAALSPSTVIVGALFQPDDDFYCISADVEASIYDHTAGEGPIEFGLCHGDYSVTEVKECLEAQTNYTSPHLLVENEQRKRKVRRIGHFSGVSVTEKWNDGNAKRIPIRFKIGASKNLNMWGMNKDDDALTTGTDIVFTGLLYGRWA